jgi:GrpE
MTYFVIKGEGIFTIDSEDYLVKEKDLVVIPPQKAFTYTGKMELLLLSTPSWKEASEETLGRNEKWDSYTPPEVQSESANLQNALARSQADYQNLLMRVERDKADMVHFLSAKILLPLLTQVDNLERAVKTKE